MQLMILLGFCPSATEIAGKFFETDRRMTQIVGYWGHPSAQISALNSSEIRLRTPHLLHHSTDENPRSMGTNTYFGSQHGSPYSVSLSNRRPTEARSGSPFHRKIDQIGHAGLRLAWKHCFSRPFLCDRPCLTCCPWPKRSTDREAGLGKQMRISLASAALDPSIDSDSRNSSQQLALAETGCHISRARLLMRHLVNLSGRRRHLYRNSELFPTASSLFKRHMVGHLAVLPFDQSWSS